MRISTLAALAVAVLSICAASAANAQVYVSANAGTTDVGTTSAFNLSPSGTVLDIRVGDTLYSRDFTVAVEAGVQLGDVEDSQVIQTCTVTNCGYDEFDTERRKADWSGSLGLKVGHELGPVTLFVTGGLRVTQMTASSSYDSGGVYPSGKYEQTNYVFGAYYGAGVAYPVNSRLSVTLAYERADLTRMSWSSTWGSGDDGFNQETVSVGLTWTFGK